MLTQRVRRSAATITAAALVLSPLVLLAGCVGVPLDGKASQAFSASEPAPKAVFIETRFLDVAVEVLPASAGETTVSARGEVDIRTSGGDATAQRELPKVALRTVRDGDRLTVSQGEKGAKLDAQSFSGSGSLTVRVPSGIPISIRLAAGDVVVRGDVGPSPLSLATAAGDVRLVGAADEISVDVAAGDVRLELSRPAQKVAIDVAAGDVALTGGAAVVEAETASGDVALADLGGVVRVSTASGDVQLQFRTFGLADRADVSTASGSIGIWLPAGATPGGTVSTASGSLDIGVPATIKQRSATFTGSVGTISAEAASGSVTVRTKS